MTGSSRRGRCREASGTSGNTSPQRSCGWCATGGSCPTGGEWCHMVILPSESAIPFRSGELTGDSRATAWPIRGRLPGRCSRPRPARGSATTEKPMPRLHPTSHLNSRASIARWRSWGQDLDPAIAFFAGYMEGSLMPADGPGMRAEASRRPPHLAIRTRWRPSLSDPRRCHSPLSRPASRPVSSGSISNRPASLPRSPTAITTNMRIPFAGCHLREEGRARATSRAGFSSPFVSPRTEGVPFIIKRRSGRRQGQRV